jgi:hypothetical protein
MMTAFKVLSGLMPVSCASMYFGLWWFSWRPQIKKLKDRNKQLEEINGVRESFTDGRPGFDEDQDLAFMTLRCGGRLYVADQPAFPTGTAHGVVSVDEPSFTGHGGSPFLYMTADELEAFANKLLWAACKVRDYPNITGG